MPACPWCWVSKWQWFLVQCLRRSSSLIKMAMAPSPEKSWVRYKPSKNHLFETPHHSRCEFVSLHMIRVIRVRPGIGTIRTYMTHDLTCVCIHPEPLTQRQPGRRSNCLNRSLEDLNLWNRPKCCADHGRSEYRIKYIIHSKDFQIQKHDKRLAPNPHRKL